MNKEEIRRLVKKKVFVGVTLGLMLGLIIGGGIMAQQAYEQRIKYEAVTGLFMFTLNVSNYCAESNNMTYQELLDGYVIKMAHELIEGRNVEEINDCKILDSGRLDCSIDDALVSGEEQ